MKTNTQTVSAVTALQPAQPGNKGNVESLLDKIEAELMPFLDTGDSRSAADLAVAISLHVHHIREALTPDAAPHLVCDGPIEVGSTVTWRSQAGGAMLTKTGIVREVVKAGKLPDRDRVFRTLYDGPGVVMQRDHESYVVEAGWRFYWPCVTCLRLAQRKQGAQGDAEE